MFLIILLIVPMTFLLTALFSQRRRTRLLADASTHPGLTRLDRTTVRARWAGLVVGVVVASVLAGSLRLGRGLVLAPAVVALFLACSLAVGELVAWRAARTPGVASLETRSASRYLPRTPLAALGASSAVLAGLLLWCRANQNTEPDALGTIGRQYSWRSADGMSGGGSGPFPGTFYSVTLSWALLALAAVLVTGLILAIRRPRNGSDPVVVAVDDQVRRRSAEALAATGVLGVAGSLAPCALLASVSLFPWHPLAGSAALALACCALAVVSWAAAVLLVPGRGEKVA